MKGVYEIENSVKNERNNFYIPALLSSKLGILELIEKDSISCRIEKQEFRNDLSFLTLVFTLFLFRYIYTYEGGDTYLLIL